MQNLLILYEAGFRSFKLEEPPSMTGHVFAIPLPLTCKYVNPCSSSYVKALADCSKHVMLFAVPPRQHCCERDLDAKQLAENAGQTYPCHHQSSSRSCNSLAGVLCELLQVCLTSDRPLRPANHAIIAMNPSKYRWNSRLRDHEHTLRASRQVQGT